MKRKLLYIGGILLVCCMLVAIGMTIRLNEEITTLPAIGPKIAANIHYHPQMKDSIQKPKPVVKKMDFNISGTLLDTDGKGVTGVIVSDGYHCVKTDSSGRYKMKRDSLARFIYYSVPADCEVPTHSETDRTACFYQAVSNDKKKYDFTLTRLPGGKEVSYKMIVIGDPQVTNAYSPYYTSPDDNPIKKSDVERFTTQTMADIKQTIKSLPAGTPVYGLSMGDDVQYYGGYNAKLERQIRQALALQRCVSSPSSAITTRMGRHSIAGNGRKISVLPIFPSTVAMCIMSASTTASSIAACLIILLENCVSAR